MSENSADCLFCKIAAGDIPGDIVYEDDQFIAFNDINPQAPVHILIIPKRHIATVNDVDGEAEVVGSLAARAFKLAKKQGIDQSGYRILMNCNQEGGQTVYHIHMHLLGGKQLGFLG
ncbi:MAG: histidine triad nucleotide-binding protein [Pseudomonadales bacterium]|nr:histidine triad nucleotide-binding protein [Pseudomonadales bacterium]